MWKVGFQELTASGWVHLGPLPDGHGSVGEAYATKDGGTECYNLRLRRESTMKSTCQLAAAVILSAALLASCNVSLNQPDSEENATVEKQFMNLPHLPKPAGYTHVVTSPPGKMVFLSGQGGAGEDGELPDDFATQAENTFKNIQKCLEMAGASFDDVVKMNYYLIDVEKLAEVRDIRAKYINMDTPPASTLVETPLIGALQIEVDVVAVVPE